jgi:hypothetical protein
MRILAAVRRAARSVRSATADPALSQDPRR